MAAQITQTTLKPQIIPTNAGLRTFAAPPTALQEDIVPNDLFYIRNHWTDCPEIDQATYRMAVDGQVSTPLSLSYEDLKQLPQKRFQVTFECCGNSPVPDYWSKALRISTVMVSRDTESWATPSGPGFLYGTCWRKPGLRIPRWK